VQVRVENGGKGRRYLGEWLTGRHPQARVKVLEQVGELFLGN